MQTLVTIHSWFRWLVLLALVFGIGFGYLRFRAQRDWLPYVHQVVVMMVDVQVAIGVVIWVFFDGWRRGSFLAYVHPLTMLSALAVIQIAAAVAGRRQAVQSWLIVAGGSLVSLLLIVAAIPWDRL